MEQYRELYSEKEWQRMLRKEPTSKAWIYVIEDPTNKSHTCYVGKTENLKERLRCHKKDKGRARRYKLIGSIDNPKLIVLEEVPLLQWAEAERFYIAYFKSIGMELANGTPGGDVNPNPGYLTEEQKQHLSKINIGKKHTPETRKKMSEQRKGSGNAFFGKKHTEKSKIKQSKAKIGKSTCSEAERQKRSYKWSGCQNPKYNHAINNDDIVSRYLRGINASTIAKELELSYQFVYRRIKLYIRETGVKSNA